MRDRGRSAEITAEAQRTQRGRKAGTMKGRLGFWGDLRVMIVDFLIFDRKRKPLSRTLASLMILLSMILP
jgi:hypothetical protein